ncbi:MAG: ThiF family adenylyltransferase [Actinomycetota bacterium]|nr:ThiF family adenylyltransferase [Actinomycetota bacterium]
MSRFSRNEALFGTKGQDLIEETCVAICGVGGLGSHVLQQLVYLGVRRFKLIEFDFVTPSSMNRLIGALETDVPAKTPKLRVAQRVIEGVRGDSEVDTFEGRIAEAPSEFFTNADFVFGCLDKDVHRLELLSRSYANGLPYLDIATDVLGDAEDPAYGGRMVFCGGDGCLVCLPGILDQEAIAREGLDPAQIEAHRKIYGVDSDALDETGPSVVSLNGVVASLAVTEFMAYQTGLRSPFAQLTYRGELGVVTKSLDQGEPGCVFCDAFKATSER